MIETPSGIEEVGRKLAQIAVDLNEHSRDYAAYLEAFATASPLMAGLEGISETSRSELARAYHKRVSELLREIGLE
jgi:hypothetical protein